MMLLLSVNSHTIPIVVLIEIQFLNHFPEENLHVNERQKTQCSDMLCEYIDSEEETW